MRVSSTSFHCSCITASKKSSLRHCPPSSPLGSEGAHHVSPSRLSPVSIVANKKLSDSRIGIERNGLDDGELVGIVLKSSLKRPAGPGSEGKGKRRVKWMDFVGKELVEVTEFEPIESVESDDNTDGNPPCICVVQ